MALTFGANKKKRLEIENTTQSYRKNQDEPEDDELFASVEDVDIDESS